MGPGGSGRWIRQSARRPFDSVACRHRHRAAAPFARCRSTGFRRTPRASACSTGYPATTARRPTAFRSAPARGRWFPAAAADRPGIARCAGTMPCRLSVMPCVTSASRASITCSMVAGLRPGLRFRHMQQPPASRSCPSASPCTRCPATQFAQQRVRHPRRPQRGAQDQQQDQHHPSAPASSRGSVSAISVPQTDHRRPNSRSISASFSST
jgi:hypothetical protein